MRHRHAFQKKEVHGRLGVERRATTITATDDAIAFVMLIRCHYTLRRRFAYIHCRRRADYAITIFRRPQSPHAAITHYYISSASQL